MEFILEIPTATDSDELKFAMGVVSLIMGRYLPAWEGPGNPEAIATETRIRIMDLLLSRRDEYEGEFEALFGEDVSEWNFRRVARDSTHELMLSGYGHGRFLNFCVKMCLFAVNMHMDGCGMAHEIATYYIFMFLWLGCGESDERGSSALLRELETYCRLTGNENIENEPWRANRIPLG